MSRYIDADKLKEAWYTKHNITAEDHGACFVGFSELPRLIDAQPTADVRENVIAEWWHEPHKNNLWIQRCSNCFNTALITYEEECPYKYCPLCGAEMRGGKS